MSGSAPASLRYISAKSPDEGWDVIRERIFEQQKKLGVIPKDTKLAKKPDDIKDWKDLSAKEQKLFARQAEVFAAFLDMTDHETGRVIQAIEDMGELDNTLIFAHAETSYAKVHAVDNIPVMTIGSAAGRLKTGLHIAGHGDPISRVAITAFGAFREFLTRPEAIAILLFVVLFKFCDAFAGVLTAPFIVA